MFGESAPAYARIYEAIENCKLFIAIGTSGQVIDIVPIALEFKNSILINPKREAYIGSFESQGTYIDEYFEHFIQKNAGEAMDEMFDIIEEFMDA